MIHPDGNVGYGFVSKGNLLLCRGVMLLLVAATRGCRFLLEQPGQSCLSLHRRWQWLVDRVPVAFLQLRIWNFGHLGVFESELDCGFRLDLLGAISIQALSSCVGVFESYF